MAEQQISVGKLGKPHGINGAFHIYIYRELKNKKKMPSHFSLFQNGNFLPYFISKLEWTELDKGIILFDEIDTPEKAKKYSGSELFLPEKEINFYFKKDSNDYSFLIGYNIIDEQMGHIGFIKEVMDAPGQILINVSAKSGEILLPLVDDFIEEINKKKKAITLNLPEGILNL